MDGLAPPHIKSNFMKKCQDDPSRENVQGKKKKSNTSAVDCMPVCSWPPCGPVEPLHEGKWHFSCGQAAVTSQRFVRMDV